MYYTGVCPSTQAFGSVLLNFAFPCLLGRITQDEYDKKASELKQRQYEINEQQKQYTEADDQLAMTLSYLINIASRAYELFESSKAEQKRQLLGFPLSNLTLRGKKLNYTLKNPFNSFSDIQKRSKWLGDRDLPRFARRSGPLDDFTQNLLGSRDLNPDTQLQRL